MKNKKTSKKLLSFNQLAIIKLKEVAKEIDKTLYCKENEFSDFSKKTIYGLSTTIDYIERDLETIKRVKEQATKEYRVINGLEK